MRTNGGCLLRVCHREGLGLRHPRLAETQRQTEEQESSTVQDGVCGPAWRPPAWGAWTRLTRNTALNAIRLGGMCSFLWLVLSWKQEQKAGKLVCPGHVLVQGGGSKRREMTPVTPLVARVCVRAPDYFPAGPGALAARGWPPVQRSPELGRRETGEVGLFVATQMGLVSCEAATAAGVPLGGR